MALPIPHILYSQIVCHLIGIMDTLLYKDQRSTSHINFQVIFGEPKASSDLTSRAPIRRFVPHHPLSSSKDSALPSSPGGFSLQFRISYVPPITTCTLQLLDHWSQPRSPLPKHTIRLSLSFALIRQYRFLHRFHFG